MHSLNLLMQAHICCVFPEQDGNLSNFPMKIYNFMINDMVNGDFSFQFDANIKDKVTNLCRAIQEETLLISRAG
jgi:hypothetical protein